ncbi:MAG: hypothetical protein AAGF06_06775, partial [Pseudomonadota bacterium]
DMNTMFQRTMKTLLSVWLLMGLMACSPTDSSDEQPLNDAPPQNGVEVPSGKTVFKSAYALNDFNLSVPSSYWETRLFDTQENAHSVERRFGVQEYTQLSGHQQSLLALKTSSAGFAVKCRPAECPVYGVSIHNSDVMLLTNKAELKEFLGDIDTEAEAFVWLSYAQDYQQRMTPMTFEKTSDGYLVELNWDTECQLKGKDLVKVTHDGRIEKVREISRETYEGCV